MPGAVRTTLRTGLAALTIGAGWARVEGEAHYPSDVLFGAAMGNFTAIFLAGSFLPAWEEHAMEIVPAVGPGRVSLALRITF